MKRLLTILFFFVSVTIGSAQTIRYVKAVASGNSDGSNWNNASADLQAMIDVSAAGDEIWMAAGTYYPTTLITPDPNPGSPTATDRDKAFVIKKNIKIYGGFNGSETVFSQRDFNTNATIINGNIGNGGVNTDNCYHLLYISTPVGGNLNNSLVIDGIEFREGNANLGSVYNNMVPRYSGAAIFITIDDIDLNNTPAIRNCKFIDNFSYQSGGAIYADAFALGTETLLIDNCTFENNSSAYRGGAIGFFNHDVNSEIYKATISNSTFIGNSANNDSQGGPNGGIGGAIGAFKSGEITVNKCVFRQNESEGNWNGTGSGSAIGLLSGASIKVVNSAFYNNVNAAIYNKESSVTLLNSTLYHPSNELIRLNSASSIALDNCIVWTDGLGQNCIVSENTPSASATLNNSILNADYQLVFTSTPSNLLTVNPLFSDAANTDFRLSVNSPAVDAGNDALYNAASYGNTDIEGNNRSIANIDLGAYEYQGTLPVELLSYTVHKRSDGVLLQWTTASEKDNRKFIISRSVDGINFVELQQVPAKSHSNIAQLYDFVDVDPISGINYYRLEQQDYNGTLTVLGVKSVDFGAGVNLVVYPNPTANDVMVSFAAQAFESLTLFNGNGQQLNRVEIPALSTEMKVSLHDYTEGMYYLVFEGKEGKAVRKLIKIAE